MTELPSKFEEFLSNIRPPDEQIDDYVNGHEQLRERLSNDSNLSEIHVSDFLQGSYARRTAVKPIGDEKSDVDIVFVTDLPKSEYTASDAMELCEPFLNRYYSGQWEPNQRSYKIELNKVEMDLVLTAAPSEAVVNELSEPDSIGKANIAEIADQQDMEIIAKSIDNTFEGAEKDWQNEPLDIPDRKLDAWDKTHPLATLDWTQSKNDRTNGHYINVVKALKWWRRKRFDFPERPKSYPLERLIGECCPDYISSVAEGVVRTLEVFTEKYESNAEHEDTPVLGQHGIPENNVLARLEGRDFAAFYDRVADASEMARRAYEEKDKEQSALCWRAVFGEKFPLIGGSDDDDTEDESTATFTPPNNTTNVSSQRFG